MFDPHGEMLSRLKKLFVDFPRFSLKTMKRTDLEVQPTLALVAWYLSFENFLCPTKRV